MKASVMAELLLLRKRAGTWVLLAIWVALSAFFGYLLPYLTYRNAAGGPVRAPLSQLLPQHITENLIGSFPFYGGAIVLILGVLSFGSEYGWGTLKTLFTQGPGRLHVFTAKILALSLALVPFVLVVFVLGSIWGSLIAWREHAAVAWPAAWPLVRALLAAWFILSVWAAFGVMLAVLTRGTSLAIGIGVLYSLAIEGLLSGFAVALSLLRPIADALVRGNAYSLVKPLTSSIGAGAAAGPGVFAGPYVGAVQALLVLAIYLAFFLALAATLLMRRDVA
jgi:ABC-2 type transport system permease protein